MRRVALVIVFLLAVPFIADAFTITVDRTTVFGNARVALGRFNFDSSYPTGGEAASLANCSNSTVSQLWMMNVASRTGYVFDYDYSAYKVLAYREAAIATHTHTYTDTIGAHTHTVTDTLASHGHTVSDTMSGHTHNIAVTNGTAGTTMRAAAGVVNVNGNGTDIATSSTALTMAATTSSNATTLVATTASTALTFAGTSAAGGSVSAGALAEVANTTNLAALTNVRYMMYGL